MGLLYRNRKSFLLIVLSFMLILVFLFQHSFLSYKNSITIFHAGSLTSVIEDLALIMKNKYNIEILNEPSGSIDAIRKITDLDKIADIVMVADYRLIPNMMLSKADWALIFATNEMVVVFTEKSKYSNEINSENWLKILLKPDVRIGFSDPNKDPCGYRSLMVLGLASIYYNNEEPLKMLEKHAGIKYISNENGIFFDVSEGVNPDSLKIFIRSKEVDLLALIETGIIDYAFEYRNIAISKKLKYIELPKEINLAEQSLDDFYSKVFVTIIGEGGSKEVLKGSFISYGLTIPKNALHKDNAEKFIELLISKEGKKILLENEFKPLETLVVIGKAPEWLKRE
ncbi:MAG: tungstate ABC transporter substrate-binding protein WtpA [Candidatus Aenigmatarchaeota archaeon]